MGDWVCSMHLISLMAVLLEGLSGKLIFEIAKRRPLMAQRNADHLQLISLFAIIQLRVLYQVPHKSRERNETELSNII